MACTGVIPIFTIAILLIFIRSFRKEINSALARETNHGNFAAMLIIGIATQCAILGMDIAAVCYVYTKHYEYKDYKLQNTVNLFITAITLAFDTTVGFFLFLSLMYMWCTFCYRATSHSSCPKCFLEIFHFCCMIPCFYAIFGDVRQAKGLDVPKSYGDVTRRSLTVKVADQRMSWILLNMLIAPLFSLASHSGYILMAWLTELILLNLVALTTNLI